MRPAPDRPIVRQCGRFVAEGGEVERYTDRIENAQRDALAAHGGMAEPKDVNVATTDCLGDGVVPRQESLAAGMCGWPAPFEFSASLKLRHAAARRTHQ